MSGERPEHEPSAGQPDRRAVALLEPGQGWPAPGVAETSLLAEEDRGRAQPALPPLTSQRRRRALRLPAWLLTTVALIVVLAVWTYVAQGRVAQQGLIPTPWVTLATLFELLRAGPFWRDLGTTLYRLMAGFLASVAVGVPLGIGIGLSPTLSGLFGGLIDGLKYTPISAFIPLSIILFGVGDSQKVAILLLATAPYMTVMTADAVRSTRSEYIEGALTLGASPVQIVTRVVLAAAAPQIWNAARLALAIAWTYVITAELVGAQAGLGRFLLRSERFFNTREILATVIVIGVIGWLSDVVFRLLFRRWFGWSILLSQER